MDITTARVEPHERAKSEDFDFGFQSIIKNTALLDRMLTTANIDYLFGGTVKVVHGTLNITVEPLWANGKTLEWPAFQDVISSPMPVTVPISYPRYSIVQIRGLMEDYDKQRRSFFDPELETVLFYDVNTKSRLVTEISIKNGNEGVDFAPNADTGYIKIAEIYLEPETTELTSDNIRNVNAAFQGSENTQWTAEKTRTFLVGSMSNLWEAFDREHYADGQHREAVIKANNILLGIAKDALKSSNISIGETIKSGDISAQATASILETLCLIGQILHGDTANTLMKKLSMLISWKSNETYQPFAPTFFQGRIFYANPLNLPKEGENPEDFPTKWINSAGDIIYMPPSDGQLYGMRNRNWTVLNFGSDAIEALKFFSKQSLMITNAKIVDRRLRGWDLGLKYLSPDHEVYHFDTDNNNQYQFSSIVIGYDKEPKRMGIEDSTEELSFEPAVSNFVPFEMIGKSLYGIFSVSGKINAQNSTLEFWMRMSITENSVLLRLGTTIQDLITLNIGGADPEYSAPIPGDIPYSHPDLIDGILYSQSIIHGNFLYHDWGEGNERVNLDNEGVKLINQKIWVHIAFVLTPTHILFFIGEFQFSFTRHRPAIDPLPFILNEDMNIFNLDELSIINGAMVDNDSFLANNIKRIPYAGLDYQQKNVVFMVDSPDNFRTNIFESKQFKEAVQEIINKT